MAFRRLAIVVGSVSTPTSRLATPNPHVISTTRPIFDFLHRHHLSVSATADESASKVAPINPDDPQGFQKWHNGGGLFHMSACIAATAVIEIGAVVHREAVIGANTHICSGTIIGPSVTIGQSTKLGYNAALSNCALGDCCVIHNGVCIGQDGFGFFVDELGGMVKKPQILKALIGHHVEIGANTCIDRGSWRDTTIGDYVKIDNLVQIGHNVVIGKYAMLCGQVGIAGSVTIGDYVTLGGRVAVRDHVSLTSKWMLYFFWVPLCGFTCDSWEDKNGLCYEHHWTRFHRVLYSVRLAANSCVTKDIKVPGDYGGFPAVPVHEWRRQVAVLRRTLK